MGNGTPRSQQLPDPNRKREQLKWFYDQRAYPSGHIPENGRGKALAQMDGLIQREIQMGLRSAPVANGIIPFPGSTTNWLFIGPGRLIKPSAATVDHQPPAAGSLHWQSIPPTPLEHRVPRRGRRRCVKTTDGGATWATNFDSQPSLSSERSPCAIQLRPRCYVGRVRIISPATILRGGRDQVHRRWRKLGLRSEATAEPLLESQASPRLLDHSPPGLAAPLSVLCQ